MGFCYPPLVNDAGLSVEDCEWAKSDILLTGHSPRLC
jgi:hypothetical protein